jgi:hypothetical protein
MAQHHWQRQRRLAWVLLAGSVVTLVGGVLVIVIAETRPGRVVGLLIAVGSGINAITSTWRLRQPPGPVDAESGTPQAPAMARAG